MKSFIRFPLLNADPNTPPAGAPVTPPPAAPAPQDWTSGLNDELKGYVQNKGFKDPASALDSYRNLEKLMGAPRERLVTLPESLDDMAALAPIFDKLGRPSKAEEYDFKYSEEMGGDQLATYLKNNFHELGVTKKQGEAIAKKLEEHFNGEVEKTKTQVQADFAKQEAALKTEWGNAHDQNIGIARKAMNALGMDVAKIDALEASLGYDGVMKFLHNIGSRIGEDKFVTNDGAGKFIMTPEAARVKIEALKADKAFGSKLMAKDAQAKIEWDNLHQMAYPQQ